MDDGQDTPTPTAWARRLGASEGTGFGFLAAGCILGMAWLGEAFGSPVPLNEGGYALGFFLAGAAILTYALMRRQEP